MKKNEDEIKRKYNKKPLIKIEVHNYLSNECYVSLSLLNRWSFSSNFWVKRSMSGMTKLSREFIVCSHNDSHFWSLSRSFSISRSWNKNNFSEKLRQEKKKRKTPKSFKFLIILLTMKQSVCVCVRVEYPNSNSKLFRGGGQMNNQKQTRTWKKKQKKQWLIFKS